MSGETLSTAEVAEVLDTSKTHVGRLLRSGAIPAPVARPLGPRRWRKEDIERFMQLGSLEPWSACLRLIEDTVSDLLRNRSADESLDQLARTISTTFCKILSCTHLPLARRAELAEKARLFDWSLGTPDRLIGELREHAEKTLREMQSLLADIEGDGEPFPT